MKSLFRESEFRNLFRRVQSLRPDAVRQWGAMEVPQMLAHVNRTLDVPLGHINPPSEVNFFLRFIIKRFALRDSGIPKGAPTARAHLVGEPKNFEEEKSKVLQNLNEFRQRGVRASYNPHVSFGPLTPEEWRRLKYKHSDHHLKQFSA